MFDARTHKYKWELTAHLKEAHTGQMSQVLSLLYLYNVFFNVTSFFFMIYVIISFNLLTVKEPLVVPVTCVEKFLIGNKLLRVTWPLTRKPGAL